ncbi:lysylphosphatidylglycerol synthase transmembrane domain-containing protein [Nocardioides guangzhouensis]|uniref:lysylphosphatidylglycerol synthase transmembrane domain-containing protein n=1 Tax=Nocardioides guangzhouensis TaxID=2497878 RepID=UPI001438644B|nr:YbhN family protein [Nocardioides guangzhouensis]
MPPTGDARVVVSAAWRWVRGAGAVVVAVAAVEYGVLPALASARNDLAVLQDVVWALLPLAVALEVASLAAYTGLTQVLLPRGDRLRFGTQWRIDLVGFGFSHALPGGGATAGALRVRLMVDRGVAASAALALTVLQVALSVLGLLSVWLLGALMSVPRTGLTVTTVLLVVAIAVAVGALEVAPRTGTGSPRAPGRLARLWRRLVPQRWRSVVGPAVTRGVESLRDGRVTRAGMTWAVANWLLDAICLWVCLAAAGASVPVELVIAAYGLVNVVALLPITPGGIGIVEGLLVPALVATGAPAGSALVGVLTWRLLQYWLPLPVAGLCWVSLGRPGHRLWNPGPADG